MSWLVETFSSAPCCALVAPSTAVSQLLHPKPVSIMLDFAFLSVCLLIGAFGRKDGRDNSMHRLFRTQKMNAKIASDGTCILGVDECFPCFECLESGRCKPITGCVPTCSSDDDCDPVQYCTSEGLCDKGMFFSSHMYVHSPTT